MLRNLRFLLIDITHFLVLLAYLLLSLKPHLNPTADASCFIFIGLF